MPQPNAAGLTGLDHILLEMPRAQEERARGFYRDFLRLTELQKPPGLSAEGVWFALPDGSQLHLGTVGEHRPAPRAHPCFRCADLAAFGRWAQACGVPLEEDGRAGVPRVFLQDPFGNRLEVVEGEHPSHPR